MASIEDGVPSVSIVFAGTHAVIVKGFDWTSTVSGPRADIVRFHDPMYPTGENYSETVGLWKSRWFTAYKGQYAIVVGYPTYRGQGESGYIEFLNQGGTYYGGPKEYKPPYQTQ